MTNKELETANELKEHICQYENIKLLLERWVGGSANMFVLEFPNTKKPSKRELFIRRPYSFESMSFEADKEMLRVILKEVERQLQEFREEFGNIGKGTHS